MTNDDHTGTDVPAREEGTHSLSAARAATLIGTPPPRPTSRVKPVLLMGLLSVVAVVAAYAHPKLKTLTMKFKPLRARRVWKQRSSAVKKGAAKGVVIIASPSPNFWLDASP